MKRPEKQKRLSLFGVLLFSLGCVWIVAQSNANDDVGLTIDTDRYTAVQNIQEIHLNSSDGTSSQRIGLVNTGSTLWIGTVEGWRVGALKNTVQGNASVVGWERNVSQGDETTLILWGEGNAISGSTSNSVIMGGNSNKVFNKSDIILASSWVKANNSEAIALASESSRLQGKNSAVYGARNSMVNWESSMAMGNNVTIKQPGVFVFSVRSGSIEANKKHTFVVNAENGLIIGATKNIASNIKLTVNWAARVGEAKGGDANVAGAVFRVACSNPSGASCLCANVGGTVKSISSNPACNNVCSKRSQNCRWGATCGTRARTDYAVAETDWRANERYCWEGSHPDSTPDFPQRPADSASWTCSSDFGGSFSSLCIASKKVQKKENAECGTYHGMSFIGSTIKNWPIGGSFCKKGTPTPTIPIFSMTGKPVTWTCSGTNLSPVQCQANGCNRCSKDGFPYCFPVDLDPSCKGAPTSL